MWARVSVCGVPRFPVSTRGPRIARNRYRGGEQVTPSGQEKRSAANRARPRPDAQGPRRPGTQATSIVRTRRRGSPLRCGTTSIVEGNRQGEVRPGHPVEPDGEGPRVALRPSVDRGREVPTVEFPQQRQETVSERTVHPGSHHLHAPRPPTARTRSGSGTARAPSKSVTS